MTGKETALNQYKGSGSSYYLGGFYTGSNKSNSGLYYNIDGKRIPKNSTDPFGIAAKAEAELKEKWDKMEQEWDDRYEAAKEELSFAEKARKYALKMWYFARNTQHKKAKELEEITQGDNDLSHLSSFDQIRVRRIHSEITDAKDLERASDTDFAIAGMEVEWALHDKAEAGRQSVFIDYFKPDNLI